MYIYNFLTCKCPESQQQDRWLYTCNKWLNNFFHSSSHQQLDSSPCIPAEHCRIPSALLGSNVLSPVPLFFFFFLLGLTAYFISKVQKLFLCSQKYEISFTPLASGCHSSPQASSFFRFCTLWRVVSFFDSCCGISVCDLINLHPPPSTEVYPRALR